MWTHIRKLQLEDGEHFLHLGLVCVAALWRAPKADVVELRTKALVRLQYEYGLRI